MRTPAIALAVLCVLAPAAHAQTFRDSRDWQADCQLAHIRDTRSPLGVSLIGQACNYLSLRVGRPRSREGGYYECVLAVVPGSQSDAAASALDAACRQRFP